MKILKINSSVQPIEASVTRQFVDKVVEKISDGNAEVIDRDLSQGVSLLTGALVGSFFTPPGDRTAAQQELVGESDGYVQELMEADAVVIGAPIYNFGVPGALKAYFDLIARVGVTFRYTERGPEGLIPNKKTYLVVASGGTGLGSEADFNSGYIQFFLSFLGIKDITIVEATQLMADKDAALGRATSAVARIGG